MHRSRRLLCCGLALIAGALAVGMPIAEARASPEAVYPHSSLKTVWGLTKDLNTAADCHATLKANGFNLPAVFTGDRATVRLDGFVDQDVFGHQRPVAVLAIQKPSHLAQRREMTVPGSRLLPDELFEPFREMAAVSAAPALRPG
jgi:hypothetical protein